MADFFCPDRDRLLQALIRLLPRGRAWQTHDGGPRPGYGVGFHSGGYFEGGFQTQSKPYSVLWLFWLVVAEVSLYVHERLCQLRREFWCATMSETQDWWLTEYGLPNRCDPFPDLCVKVAAMGGSRCEYYAFIAARAGWSISCVENYEYCGTRVGSRRSKAGCMRVGRTRSAVLKIIVDLDGSPAYSGNRHKKALVGRFQSGRRLSCGPNISPLECILTRVIHAEILTVYEVI